ncbi:MAG TPA: ComEC/Rec2 family competence protein [Kiritimatiellia bacterium]|nr:ComEC/Rec2 family competence protein [Kiritimatiellia bacterium]
MLSQNRIILFCYCFIVGLVAAMAWPSDPAALSVLRGFTAVALLAAGGLLLYVQHRTRGGAPAPTSAHWFAWLLMAGALSLGYTRYITANTVPDTRVGEIALAADGARYTARAALPDTCRLRVRKTQELEADLRLRLVGDLDARVVVRDDSGRAIIDRKGRWQFQLAPRSITTDVVVVRAEDPVGTDYVIDQPLTRITGVQLVSGPDRGAVALYRISNHISAFVRPGRAQSPVTILGHISADPLVYDFRTVLPVTPEFIQYPAGGPFYRVEGGDIQVTVRPDLPGYEQFAVTEAYGHDIEFSGELTVARAAANPGGFNARRFMQNHNVYGLVSIFTPRSGPAPIHVITPVDGPVREGHPLVEYSLRLRDDVLRVIKQTMLYPQSAFVGGVTLGLRYGLHGVECMFSEKHHHVLRGEDEPTVIGRYCEDTIADEFKEAGVNHVLAVSGLHVTILSVMFVGIFSLLRLPRQAYVPLIILILIIFAIITGARPSTLRAVIMNSLFMLTWAYLDQSLRSSVLIGVPVAAFLILLHNPLVVVDPSFTLSFGAILSLGLLTTPCLDLLQRLKGNQFVFVLVVGLGLTFTAMNHWALAVTPQFLLPAAALVLVLFHVAGALQRKGVGVPETVNYSTIPEGVGAFLAAQFAIQIGMMIPLSAAYFARWPFAGAYANLIAIPLIGIVVQLGAIGGLLGLIPGAGIYIALLLGAANWVFSSIFLWIAHASADLFPYPFIRRPGLLALGAYYAGCAWFIWRQPLRTRVEGWLRKAGLQSPWAPRTAVTLGLLAIGGAIFTDMRPEPARELRMTVLSVGYGSAVLVESPGGKRILIDAGFVEHERGRRNEATRTVIPYLAYQKIRKLDAVILTSPRPERAAGISHVLAHTWVDRLFVPPTLADLRAGETYDDFAARFTRTAAEIEPATLAVAYEELIGNASWPRRGALAPELARRKGGLINQWAGWHVRKQTISAGQALFEEQGPGGTFRIEVLNPVDGARDARDFDNGALVLRVVYGEFAALLTSDLQYDAVGRLAQRYDAAQLRSQVLFLPHRGAALGQAFGDFKPVLRGALGNELGALLEKAKPERVIAEWGTPRPVVGMLSRDATIAHELARQYVIDRLGEAAWLSTDRDLALTFSSDGRGYSLVTQAELNRAAGGEEDAVSDLAIGL